MDQNSFDEALELIFSIKRDLFLKNDKISEYSVIENAVKEFPGFHIELSKDEDWTSFKQKLFEFLGIHETLEDLRENLKNMRLGRLSLDVYYQKISKLVKFSTILEYDRQQDWKKLFSVVIEEERRGIEAFIEGLWTEYATYLMLKTPSTLEEAYNLTKNRIERDRIVVDLKPKDDLKTKLIEISCTKPEKKQKMCPSIALEAENLENRKFLFHVCHLINANFIKVTSLPPETIFEHDPKIKMSPFGNIQTIGQIKLFLKLSEKGSNLFTFYVLPIFSNVEDDGILCFKSGTMVKTENGFVFKRNLWSGETEWFVLGMDCPKRGNCGHWKKILQKTLMSDKN